MTQTVPILPWAGTSYNNVNSPTASTSCNFDLDNNWYISFLSSYASNPIKPLGVTVNNAANGTAVQMVIGSTPFVIPGNYIQDFLIDPADLKMTLTCSSGTTDLKFWVDNPSANLSGAPAQTSSIPSTPIIPNCDFAIDQLQDSGLNWLSTLAIPINNDGSHSIYGPDGWFFSSDINHGGAYNTNVSISRNGSYPSFTLAYKDIAITQYMYAGCVLSGINNNQFFGKQFTLSYDAFSSGNNSVWPLLLVNTVDLTTGPYRDPLGAAVTIGVGGTIPFNVKWSVVSFVRQNITATQTRYSVTYTFPASFNIAAIVWANFGALTVSIARPQIDMGPQALTYRNANITTEKARAQKSIILAGASGTGLTGLNASGASATAGRWNFAQNVTMNYAPTFKSNAFAPADWSIQNVSQTYTLSSVLTMDLLTAQSLQFHCTTGAAPWPPPGSGYQLADTSAGATEYIAFDARF